jgi:HAD superfamily phosphatase
VAKIEMSAIVVFDIDGVIRDVGNSYRRALAATVTAFTTGAYRPTAIEIDQLKGEGRWNNDWEASQELIYRYFESQGRDRSSLQLDYGRIVAYFQTKYRGTDPVNWNGYICDEPILASLEYFADLTAPVLVAMEDAPGKPDPAGLFMAVAKLESQHEQIDSLPIVYVGDTVADMQTIVNARTKQPQRKFVAVGVLPPHILTASSQVDGYRQSLLQAGGAVVIDRVRDLTPALINVISG